MRITNFILVSFSLLMLTGCVASTKQLTNRLDMTLNTSLSIEEVASLESYGIDNKKSLMDAYSEAKKYGYSETYWGIVNLEKSKLAAKKSGISLESYLEQKKQEAQLAAEMRSQTLGFLKASEKYDNKLNLKEPIYLTCSRITKNGYTGKIWKNFAYLTITNTSLDYISGGSKGINLKNSFYDKPISVKKFRITALKNGSAFSDKRNHISIDRNSLKLTHNEYLSYGGKTKPLYPNNSYSYNCDLSSNEKIEWQKSQKQKFYEDKTLKEQKRKKRLEKRLNDRRI